MEVSDGMVTEFEESLTCPGGGWAACTQHGCHDRWDFASSHFGEKGRVVVRRVVLSCAEVKMCVGGVDGCPVGKGWTVIQLSFRFQSILAHSPML